MRGLPELLVRRDDLAACQLVADESARRDLGHGEALLLIERFALSSNIVTYAIMGEQPGYWRIFPAPDGWGRIPAWGYTRVIASRSPALAEGLRVLGLVPDGPAPHRPPRAELAPVYNRYVAIGDEQDEAALVMRPLFATAVVLDLLLSEADFDGARTVVLTSASSKTAHGLAHLLRARPVTTVGLTSPARRAWVQRLALYDAVLAYEAVERLRKSGLLRLP